MTKSQANRLDDWFTDFADQLSDRVSPVLVKELRQILKSRYFGIAFLFMVGLAWFWSFVFVSSSYQSILFGSLGQTLFSSYLRILTIPLYFIVPLFAFHSMLEEFQSRTFETVAVTAMTSGQLAQGKLKCALIHLSVYFTAMFPFLVFTYLLQGINLLTIFYYSMLTFAISTMLSVLGIVIAATAQRAMWSAIGGFVLVFSCLVTYLISFGMLSPWVIWDIGLEDLGIFVTALFTIGIILLIVLVGLLEAASQRLRTYNQFLRPYRVVERPDGTVKLVSSYNQANPNENQEEFVKRIKKNDSNRNWVYDTERNGD